MNIYHIFKDLIVLSNVKCNLKMFGIDVILANNIL